MSCLFPIIPLTLIMLPRCHGRLVRIQNPDFYGLNDPLPCSRLTLPRFTEVFPSIDTIG
jgi:hypothetical protein